MITTKEARKLSESIDKKHFLDKFLEWIDSNIRYSAPKGYTDFTFSKDNMIKFNINLLDYHLKQLNKFGYSVDIKKNQIKISW